MENKRIILDLNLDECFDLMYILAKALLEEENMITMYKDIEQKEIMLKDFSQKQISKHNEHKNLIRKIVAILGE